MLVTTTDGHLVEVPFATGVPRAVYDLGVDLDQGGTTVTLAGGGYAVLDRHALRGERLIVVPVEGDPLAYPLPDGYEQLRSAEAGRVLLLGNDLSGMLLVLGYRDGRLRELGQEASEGILIGCNGGGDFYFAQPDGAVALVEHDAEGLPFRHWYSVESMLEDTSEEE
jgi:hypothetical protein